MCILLQARRRIFGCTSMPHMRVLPLSAQSLDHYWMESRYDRYVTWLIDNIFTDTNLYRVGCNMKCIAFFNMIFKIAFENIHGYI